MSETTEQPTEATDETATEATTPETPEATPEGDTEPTTFTADYVKELREEAAAHRIKAKRTDAANERMVRTIAEMDGRLFDAEDLTMSDDMLDEDGIAQPERVREAISTLIESKPHLAKRTPTTPLPMGVRETEEPAPSLFQMVRERM
jgi:hypothetical protein